LGPRVLSPQEAADRILGLAEAMLKNRMSGCNLRIEDKSAMPKALL